MRHEIVKPFLKICNWELPTSYHKTRSKGHGLGIMAIITVHNILLVIIEIELYK